jgi:hypothetical protein
LADGGGRTAIVAAVVTAAGAIIAAVVTGVVTHLSSPGTPQPYLPGISVTAAPSIESARLIQKCETTHGMSQRSERNANSAGDVITFSACAWPPPPSADPDGYTRIVATAAQGPGQSNASGTNVVDRITGPCSAFSLSYSFGSQGSDMHLSPIIVRTDSVVQVEDPGTAFAGQLPFFPARGESDVVHNSNYTLDAATCVR